MMQWTAPGLIWLLVVLLWAFAVGGATWGALRLVRRPRPRPTSVPSPLDLLERRFAAGEITREDFDQACVRLRHHDLDI
jgi:putative membrane protein